MYCRDGRVKTKAIAWINLLGGDLIQLPCNVLYCISNLSGLSPQPKGLKLASIAAVISLKMVVYMGDSLIRPLHIRE